MILVGSEYYSSLLVYCLVNCLNGKRFFPSLPPLLPSTPSHHFFPPLPPTISFLHSLPYTPIYLPYNPPYLTHLSTPSHPLLVIPLTKFKFGGMNHLFLFSFISFTLFTFHSASCWIFLPWLPCNFYRLYPNKQLIIIKSISIYMVLFPSAIRIFRLISLICVEKIYIFST